MDQTRLLAEIEAVKQAIGDAERELSKIVGDIAAAPRAEKNEVSEVVRAAFLKLEAAKRELTDMERSVALAKLEGAKAAITEAERNLEKAIDEIEISARAEKTWMTQVVVDAFARLKAAKGKLVDLGKSIASEKD